MHIYMLSDYLKTEYGKKLNKISIDAGMTCPNRDGNCGTGGCIFCRDGGAGKAYSISTRDIESQIEIKKAEHGFDQSVGFIAYFQSYSNTYDNVDNLKRLYLPVINRADVHILSIATRPDCIDDEVADLLSQLNRIKPVWVELGLQTIHERTADFIRRGYALPCYDNAVKLLHKAGVKVITHLIFGLPNESKADMIESAEYVGRVTDGVKFHSLYIEEGTDIARLYKAGEIKLITRDEYIDTLCDAIRYIPRGVTVHRLTGDCNKETLIAPRWSSDKIKMLRAIKEAFYDRDIVQGEFL